MRSCRYRRSADWRVRISRAVATRQKCEETGEQDNRFFPGQRVRLPYRRPSAGHLAHFGRLLWVLPALPGSTRDLTAARQHGIIETLTAEGLKCWTDKAYQGTGGPVRVPFRGRRLKRWKRRHNSSHAKIRCLGEPAMDTLKGWRILRRLRCSTNRITDIVKAILVLHHAST